MRIINKKKEMYQLLCQLFIAITENHLPEDVFDVFWPLLQGSRKGRSDVGLGVIDYSLITPYQILLRDIPCHYYQTWEQFKKLRKKMNGERFRKNYYLDGDRECKPVHHSRRIWKDVVYEKPMVQLNYILYMRSEEEKNMILRNIDRGDTIRGVDISWMSCCVFCGDFMRLRSYSLKNEKLDIESACKQVNRLGYNYDEKFNSIGKRNTSGIPVCSLCKDSKDRQGEYRMNMLSRGDWGESLYYERNEQYHRSIGEIYPKPDMSEVPKELECSMKTPYEYCHIYWELTDPLSDWFWRPDLTADEYMRWVEHTRLSTLNFDDLDPLDEDFYDQYEENTEYVVADMIECMIQKLEQE